jgi:hypothetical protein
MISVDLTESGIVAIIVVALVVAYGIRVALSGKRGRPQGPMI